MKRRGIRGACLALASAFIVTALAATPAHAVTAAHILTAQISDGGSVAVAVSVSCDPLSEFQSAIVSVYLTQGEFGRPNFAEGFGFFGSIDTNLLTCDGNDHAYTIVLEPGGASVADRFRPGRTSFTETVLQISTETAPNTFFVEPVSVVNENIVVRR